MQIRKVTLIGGSGFVGSHIAASLATRGIQVVIPTRRRERVKHELIILPTADVIEANVHDDRDLDRVITGSDAVVSLVGILHERRRGDFRRAHGELVGRIVEACARRGVTRLLHMSALAADPAGPSAYLRSKGEGEAIARAAADRGIAATIFRPSVIFGRGDSFLSLFAALLRWMPVVALGSPGARFQPVWVEDVARAFEHALAEPATFGATYDLCGPRVYTLRELVSYVGEVTGRRRPIIGLSSGLSWLQAALMELSPVKLLTRDNVRSMQVDNVCNCPYPSVFGGAPAALEAIAPGYLAAGARARYQGMRSTARR